MSVIYLPIHCCDCLMMTSLQDLERHETHLAVLSHMQVCITSLSTCHNSKQLHCRKSFFFGSTLDCGKVHTFDRSECTLKYHTTDRIKTIEGRYGSAVATFYRLMRFEFYINFLCALVTVRAFLSTVCLSQYKCLNVCTHFATEPTWFTAGPHRAATSLSRLQLKPK